MRRPTAAAALSVLVLVLAGPGTARAAAPIPQIDAAKRGLAEAVAAGRLDPADAARYRGILARAAHALPLLSGSRYTNLKGVLVDVARQAGRYNKPRALILFAMLDENVRFFGRRGPPAPQADETGSDGTVYRYFPGHGLQFHPLANMAALNSELASGRLGEARALVAALEARAIGIAGGRTVWEYEFPFDGGRPPWISGMAQAVAAQALARASGKLNDPSLLGLAERAYLALPGRLVRTLPAGPWVRLYSFSKIAVFNAQLQTSISLRDYASLSGNKAAGSLADRMSAAAKTMLPHVDTGYWTRYSIDGREESVGYHDFVVSLLSRLGKQTGDSFWSSTAARFARYETQPPIFQLGPPAAAATAGKGQATLRFSFWLSKASSVAVSVGGATRQWWMLHGWHRLTWHLPRSRAGVFPVSVEASPIAGPRAGADLLPLVVLAKDTSS